MTQRYTIEKTASTTYLDNRNNAIKGYTVFVQLLDYDEFHEINVPNLNENTVKKEIDKLLANRDKLASLGNSE